MPTELIETEGHVAAGGRQLDTMRRDRRDRESHIIWLVQEVAAAFANRQVGGPNHPRADEGPRPKRIGLHFQTARAGIIHDENRGDFHEILG